MIEKVPKARPNQAMQEATAQLPAIRFHTTLLDIFPPGGLRNGYKTIPLGPTVSAPWRDLDKKP